MAVINARSCSVSRAAGSRKKSCRTVSSLPPRCARAGMVGSAAGAAMGHSSGNMPTAYRILVNFASTDGVVARMLDDEEGQRRIDQASDDVAGPDAERGER